MKKTTSIKGGCLCGEIRYEITSPLVGADHCHCSMCRRQHGAAFATYADFRTGSFKWISGEGKVKIYETSAGNGWCFCNACGSTLAGTKNGIIASITLGTIEGDPGIRAESHIYVGSKAQWYEITDNLSQYKEQYMGSVNSTKKLQES